MVPGSDNEAELSVESAEPLLGSAPSRDLSRRIQAAISEPFDIEKGPLIRAKLFDCGLDEHVVTIVAHHLIFDGWSNGLLQRDLVQAYNKEVSDTAARDDRHAPDPGSFFRYVEERNRQVVAAPGRGARERWQRRLDEWRSPVRIPGESPCDSQIGYREFVLDADDTSALQRMSGREGVSLFMSLASVFAVLITRLTRSPRAIFATPFAGRTSTETESIIGFMSDMVPLIFDLSGVKTWRDLLVRARDTTGFAYANHLADARTIRADMREWAPEEPLFRSLFALQNTPRAKLEMTKVAIEGLSRAVGPAVLPILEFYSPVESLLDVSIALELDGDRLLSALEYRAGRFSQTAVDGWIAEFTNLARQIASEPDADITAR